MKILSKILWLIFYLVIIGFLIWIAGQLFFKEQLDTFIDEQKSKFFVQEEEKVESIRNLKVVYPVAPASLEPMVKDPMARQRFINIFEPLVKMDRDLKPRGCLALSYGILDDYTWEFRIRQGVKFHDGTDLKMEDVLASFARARDYDKSELKEVVANIDEINVMDDVFMIIKTKEPDPLLLQKISLIPIVPSEYIDSEITDFVGTGPYEVLDNLNGKDFLLGGYKEYWGGEPYFNSVQIQTIEDTMQRIDKMLNGEIDFLAFVPFDAVLLFKSSGITVESIPTLEVQFLLFNINSQILDEPVEREVIIKSINKDILAVRLGEYARTVSQFVSNGVYGYNPNLVKEYYDPDVAKQMAFGEGMNGGVVDVHLLTGLDVLGQLIRDSLVYVNIIPEIGYLDIENLKKSIDSQVADIYFMGFKSTFGDAQEFLDSVAHSKGVNNIFGYKNPKVDELIEEARVEMDNKQRLGSLQKALEIIVEEDIIGYPLIEYETLFGFKNYIQYEPRIDGLIYYDDISYKQ